MTWLQISAGLGPDECCLVVAKVAKLIAAEARQKNTELQLVEAVEGKRSETFQSLLFSMPEGEIPNWLHDWLGTIKWIGGRAYRFYGTTNYQRILQSIFSILRGILETKKPKKF